MKKYLGLWSIFLISFGIVVAESFIGDIDVNFTLNSPSPIFSSNEDSSVCDEDSEDSEDSIEVASIAKDEESLSSAKSDFSNESEIDKFKDDTQGVENTAKDEDNIETPQPSKIVSDDKTILFVGDSMLEGLSPRLAAYAKASDYNLYSVIWYSSTSEIWGETTKLKEYINKYKPGFVFICLGANELFVRNIESRRDKYVKNIIAQIGNIPYLWIGPPNWKPDTGINNLIEKNTKRGCYFKSDGMKFDRASDGAHPTRNSAVEWMDSIIRWMPAHSLYHLSFNQPTSKTAKANRVEVLKPKR